MKKNRPYARYRWREKHKKQYTFTKTKFIVGFCISVLTSVFIGSYIDRYGHLVIRQIGEAVEQAYVEEEEPTELLPEQVHSNVETTLEDAETSPEGSQAVAPVRSIELSDIAEQVRSLKQPITETEE